MKIHRRSRPQFQPQAGKVLQPSNEVPYRSGLRFVCRRLDGMLSTKRHQTRL